MQETLYCGPAPVPTDLTAAWNADPVAIALACGLVACAWLIRGEASRRSAMLVAAGLVAVLFVSPFCALTVALFSARAAHHIALVAIVAPVLAVAFPRAAGAGVSLSLLAGLHAVVLWFWHAPPVYAVAVADPFAYWAMQVTLVGSGWLMWRQVLARDAPLGPVMFSLLFTIVQMGMLGALLTFARAPLYEVHAGTTLAFGMTPLADQQLAGILMWVPAAVPYLIAAALRLSAALQPGHRTARR